MLACVCVRGGRDDDDDDGNYGDHSACDLKLPTGRQYKCLGISDHP